MDFVSDSEKYEISIDLFDRKFVFDVDEFSVGICENIRSEAKDMLDNIESFENEKVLAVVAEFLKASLERLVGCENIAEFEKCCDMTVPELTGILCYVISEIGLLFSESEELAHE